MNRRIRFVILPLALLLGSASLHAQTPTLASASVLAQAQADVAAKHFTNAVTLLQAQPTVQTDTGLRHALADAQYAWAQDLLNQSQYAQAIPHYQASYDLDKGDRLKESGDNLRRMGVAYLCMSQYTRATDFYQQALVVAKQAGDKDGEAKALMNTGIAYSGLSQPAKAIDFYQQALPIFRQSGDKVDEAKDLDNLGDVCKNLSQCTKAVDFYQQALAIYQKAGDKGGEGTVLTRAC